jgi:hypothetical protein
MIILKDQKMNKKHFELIEDMQSMVVIGAMASVLASHGKQLPAEMVNKAEKLKKKYNKTERRDKCQ